MSRVTFLLCFIILIPVLIGIYVFRDARRRNMNAVPWTLAAMFLPSFIGFIIYLIVRAGYSDLKCQKCDTRVTEKYMVCPKCGTKLRSFCQNCKTPVEAGWKVCPNCTNPLPEVQNDVVPPIHPKDHGVWKILVLIVLVPFLLLMLLIFSYSEGGVSMGTTTFLVDEYLEDTQNTQVKTWLETVGDEKDKAYVLKHVKELSDGEKRFRYLIYSPFANEAGSWKKISGGIFGETVKIDYVAGEHGVGNLLTLVTCTGEKEPRLNLYADGKCLSYEIQEVDYPIGITDSRQ